MPTTPFFKLEIYAPEESVDQILAALAQAHAGEIGNYDHCATLIPVQGFWRPLQGADPALGRAARRGAGAEAVGAGQVGGAAGDALRRGWRGRRAPQPKVSSTT